MNSSQTANSTSRSLTLWGRANSINVQKILWCCGELGLAYDQIDAGGGFGVTDTPEYGSMNPNRFVPTIEDGGFQLWESNVIVRYLCHRYGYGLCPADVEIRFDAERWMDWQATVFWPALRPLFIALIRTPLHQRDQGIIAKAESLCASAASILNDRFADRPFLGGAAFSMGDIPIGVTVHRWYALDIAHPPLPHLRRWYDKLCGRPAFRSGVMTPLS